MSRENYYHCRMTTLTFSSKLRGDSSTRPRKHHHQYLARFFSEIVSLPWEFPHVPDDVIIHLQREISRKFLTCMLFSEARSKMAAIPPRLKINPLNLEISVKILQTFACFKTSQNFGKIAKNS